MKFLDEPEYELIPEQESSQIKFACKNLRGDELSFSYYPVRACAASGKLISFFGTNLFISQNTHFQKSVLTQILKWWASYCRVPEIKGTPMVEHSSCLKWFDVTCCQGLLSADQLNSSDIKWFCSFYA